MGIHDHHCYLFTAQVLTLPLEFLILPTAGDQLGFGFDPIWWFLGACVFG